MKGVRGNQTQDPYAIGLKSGIEETLSDFVCKDIFVSDECCDCVKDHFGRQRCEHQVFGCIFTFLFD